jgi:hypothetical protein
MARLTGLAGLLFLALVLAATWPVEVWTTLQSRPEQPVGEITPDNRVAQSFQARLPGLSAVELHLATYRRVNDVTLLWRLHRDRPDGPLVAAGQIAGRTVQDNAPYRLTFPPQPDSTDRVYYLVLESPDGRPGQALTAWASRHDYFPRGRLYLNGVPAAGDLMLALGYRTPPLAILPTLLDRLAAGRPGLWGQPALYAALLAGYALALGLLVAALLAWSQDGRSAPPSRAEKTDVD